MSGAPSHSDPPSDPTPPGGGSQPETHPPGSSSSGAQNPSTSNPISVPAKDVNAPGGAPNTAHPGDTPAAGTQSGGLPVAPAQGGGQPGQASNTIPPPPTSQPSQLPSGNVTTQGDTSASHTTDALPQQPPGGAPSQGGSTLTPPNTNAPPQQPPAGGHGQGVPATDPSPQQSSGGVPGHGSSTSAPPAADPPPQQPLGPPPDPMLPFTKLHVIQADFGDSLLLEYRDTQGQQSKFWLTDGGPPGSRYRNREPKAIEHLFITLNTLTPVGQTEEGIPNLERIIATHPDFDHITGIDTIFQFFDNPNQQTGKLEAGLQGGNRVFTNLLTYSWLKGMAYLKTTRQLPWSNIWFNDKGMLNDQIPLIAEGNVALDNRESWMRDIFLELKKTLQTSGIGLTTVDALINSEFRSLPRLDLSSIDPKSLFNPATAYQYTDNPIWRVLSRETAKALQDSVPGALPHAKIISPSTNELIEFQRSGSRVDAPRSAWASLRLKSEAYLKHEVGKTTRWTTKTDTPPGDSQGEDRSPANRVSIVYEFQNAGTTSLFTGDNTGKLIAHGLVQSNPECVKYDILKIPHHGSCFNVLSEWPPNRKEGGGINCLAYCVNFFKYFKARYFCNSGNSVAQTPNPDIYTITAMILGYIEWGFDGKQAPDPAYLETSLLLTNGISYNSWKLFNDLANDPQVVGMGYNFKLQFMQRGQSYCTIDAKDGPTDGFSPIQNFDQYEAYYRDVLSAYVSALPGGAAKLAANNKIDEADLRDLGTRTLNELRKEDKSTISQARQLAAGSMKATDKKRKNDYTGQSTFFIDPNPAPKRQNSTPAINQMAPPPFGSQPMTPMHFNVQPQTPPPMYIRTRQVPVGYATPDIMSGRQPLPPNHFVTQDMVGQLVVVREEQYWSSFLAREAHRTRSAFHIPCSIRLLGSGPHNTRRNINLESYRVQADQGSDFNIISSSLVQQLALKSKPLSPGRGGTSGSMAMRTADGRVTTIHEFVEFDLGVAGIWRRIECCVVPLDQGNTCGAVHMLLGVPWLHAVNAVIQCKRFQIDIGDPERGENVATLGCQRQSDREDADLARGPWPRPHTAQLSAPMVANVFAAEKTLESLDPPPPASSSTTLEDVYHDFRISRFNMQDLSDLKYFSKDLQPAPESSSPPSPATISWVSLSRFIDLLQQDNALPAPPGTPTLDSTYFAMLRNWLPTAGAYPNGTDATLGILLTAFFDPPVASQILNALPLNPNGPAAYLNQIKASPLPPAITYFPVQNLRFEVIAANPEAMRRLEVLSMYFELHTGGANAPIPAIGTSLEPADAMTWRVPFANASYRLGHINFVHDVSKGVRVKIVWPFYQNRTLIAHFDSTMKVVRNPVRPASLPCQGSVYMKMNESASYDIQFGDMDLLDLFSVIHPQDTNFKSVFGKHFGNMGIQKLIDIVNTAVNINAHDVGLVFRQQQSFLNSVVLEDVYGTLSFDDSKVTIDLPGAGWKMPLSDLPALTLRLGNMAETKGQTLSIALTKAISDLGFIAFEATFSRSKMRPQFDATLLCKAGISLGTLVEQGFGLLDANCLDSDFLSSIHKGSLSAKSMAKGVQDVLEKIYVPQARIQVAQLPSGSYGVTELELELRLGNIAFPEDNPVVALRDFNIRVFQERLGAALQSGSSPSAQLNSPPSGGSITSIYGSATIMLGSVDANCSFTYDPSNDAEKAALGLSDTPTFTAARQLTLDVEFPHYKPTVGDLVNQVIGELSVLAGQTGTLKTQLPASLHAILDVAALETVQLTLTSEARENAPWKIASVYVVVDLMGLIQEINDIFDVDFPLEWPKLAIRVNDPSTPATRAFDIRLSSMVVVSGVRSTIVADISKGMSYAAPGPMISISYRWDPISSPLTLKHIVNNLNTSIDDQDLGDVDTGGYLTGIRKYVPDPLVSLIDDITIETVEIVVADFSLANEKSKFELAQAFVGIRDTGQPWMPFGSAWPHLSFANTSLGVSYYGGKAIGSVSTPPKGATSLTFATLMKLEDLSLNIFFNFSSSETQRSFRLSLANVGENLTLLDLIASMVNDIAGTGGIKSFSFPEDAKQLFNIDLGSLAISYTKSIEPAPPSESISFEQTGTSTFLGISVASISIVCNRNTGSWGYGLQVKLPPVTKPFAKILPVPGIEDFTVVNGFFGIFKGPAIVPPTVGPMMLPGAADGANIFLSGGLKFEGNDFLNLCGTILKIPEVDFAVQSGGSLTISIPVGKLELIIAGHPMFSVERFQLQVSQGNFMLSAELDLLCEWLAPSIKEHPIGFRFALGVGVDGSLNISIYSVDPVTGVIYPDMSTVAFITSPFYIPGLILYPFHFSMRWLTEAVEPEAIAAGGGFAIQGMPITSVFAFSIDERIPSANYIKLDIEELTISQIFGNLVPDNAENKKTFSMVDVGFKALRINITPAQKAFHVYADIYFFFLHGKVLADVDPTKGLSAAATIDPINFGNGLIELVSYDSGDSVGPFLHINTNVPDLIAGKVPQNPKTPEWASLTSNDPKLDNSIFALTAKLQFLGYKFNIFGLIDQSGLLLYTYEGIGVQLPNVDFSASRQIGVAITSSMLSANAGFNFHLEIEVPASNALGASIGKITKFAIVLDAKIALQIRYDKTEWLNDGLLFEASFECHILGLDIVVPHLRLEITVKDITNVEKIIENFIRDKLVKFLEDKVLRPLEDAAEDVEKVGKEAINVLVGGFNLAEHDVGHIVQELRSDFETLALTLKNDLGMGLDETITVFHALGHDISAFGETLESVFRVPAITVAEAAVEHGICSAEHALEAGFHTSLDKIDDFRDGAVGFVDQLGDVGSHALEGLKKGGETVLGGLEDLGGGIKHGGEDLGKKIGDGFVEFGGDVKDGAEDTGKKIAGGFEDFGNKVVDTGKDAVKSCVLM